MNYKKLAWQINERLIKGINTVADKKECLALDEQWKTFIKTASPEQLREFERLSIGLETFAMIVMGIEQDKTRTASARDVLA